MIKDYANFINESLGDGKQIFTEKLEMYRGPKNLDFYSFPRGYGHDLDDAKGIIEYEVEVDYDRTAITSIRFRIIKIAIDATVRNYKGEDDDDGEEKGIEIVFDKIDEENVEIEVSKLPYYLNNLSIDMSDCEDIDGEVDLTKARFDIKFGNEED